MERDIHKLAEYLETKLKAGLADERLLREMKLTHSVPAEEKASQANNSESH